MGLIVIPNRQACMTAEVGFRWLRHGGQSASDGDGGLEALVDDDAQDEGDAVQIDA